MEEEKEKIIKKLAELHDSITEETIKNASKEDLEKYMRLMDMIETELDLL